MLKDYLSKLFALALCLVATNLVVAQSSLTITGGDTYATAAAAFSGSDFAVTGDLILSDDGTGVTNGCDPIMVDMTDKIALIDRGLCPFSDKAVNAINAGAVGVVICNSVMDASPFLMLGNAGVFDVPVVSLDSANCVDLKMAISGGAVEATFNAPLPAESIVSAPDLTAGTHTAAAMDAGWGGTIFTGGTHAAWYRYTTTMEGVLNITTCNGTAEGTRLIVVPGNDGSQVSDAIFANVFLFSQGACASSMGSDLSFLVGAGETYYILWDDANGGAGGFDFDISESDIPMVEVTVSVDMQDVAAPAPEGAYIAGEFNGWDGEAMTDNGDGTYSHTFMAMAGTVAQYKFQNGPGGWEGSANLEPCGVDDGNGGFNRFVELGLGGANVQLVCFESCAACPPDVACPVWAQDDFEGYALGTIGDQDPDDIWTTWGAAPGTAEDGVVSDEQAASGVNSLKISDADPDDVIMDVGLRTDGNYVLKWKMFVPAGSSAYYNLQKTTANLPSPGTEDFAIQVALAADGTVAMDAGGGGAFTFSYPQDQWFEVFHFLDLDNGNGTLVVDGVEVAKWRLEWDIFNQTAGAVSIGGVDFFGNTGNLYYVDDVLFKQIEACPDNAIICDGFDGYDLNTVGNQSPWWDTWTFNPGGADDGVVVNSQQVSCEQSLEISEAGGDDVLLLLGDVTSGNYGLSWNMYVPTGSSAYYNTQKIEGDPGNEFGIQITMTDDGVGTIDCGAAAAATFNYPHDEWFNVAHLYDMDNQIASLWINGTMVFEFDPTWTSFTVDGINQLGGVDFFGNAGNLYYVDDVLFEQLPSMAGNICGGAVDLNPYTGGGVGTTVSTPLYNNSALTTEASDPVDGWDCFGEPDGLGGSPELNNTMWFTFEGDGETYFIETGDCGATDYLEDGDAQMAIYSGTDCTDLTPVVCNEDSPNATTGNFIAGTELVTEAGVTYFMLIDGFNFDGALSDGEFCINFTQMTGSEPTVSVTFGVDLTYLLETNPLETVKIAGTFGDNGAIDVPNWEPTESPVFTDQGDDVWTTTIEFPVSSAGNDLLFKFLNTADSWGSDCATQVNECLDETDAECKEEGTGDNRLFVIPGEDASICFTYNTCVPCNELVSTREQLIDLPMTIAPNPFSQEAIVTFATPLVDAKARLTTLTGQVAQSFQVNGTQLIIQKEDLTPGVYFFTVMTAEGVSTAEKLIVQ